ncbi:MAG: AAA family ATPase [Candidatus Latescibacteria bacterium]|nr:AAA family ATPase [Candidatus Latescibacterota bacterium]
MQCPACSHENPAQARFCNACGAALAPQAGPAPSPGAGSPQDSLQQYIPKDLADKIRSLGHHLESERRHVTVVFADLSGSTALSEVLDAEQVSAVLNACFKTLVEVVFKYEGTIDKFIGDEIMALFGAPIAHENDPERGIRAALEMQERLRQFNETLTTPLPKPLTMHVGINSGEVIAGNVGSDLRMDYSVLGDTVNLAARLESASPSGQIWVSEKTQALTRHLFEFRALKPFKVQGKQQKVQAYQVLGMKAVPERGRGVSEGYGPLVGRQEELAQLHALVETVRQGQGRVLGVVGDAGIGKSRLVYELQQLASSFTQASGACVSYEVPASYQVFTEVMRHLLAIVADDPEEVVRRKLEAWVGAHGLERAAVLAPLGSLFGLRDEGWLYLSDEEKRGRLKDALIAVFRAMAADQPLLLILDDLHWVDPASGRLLERLVPEVGAMPLLLCCVYRPEFQPSWTEHPSCQVLAVGPLPPEQTVKLSEALLKLDLPPELEHLIVSRSEGNPFFVEEMLKALLDEGVITRTRSGYELKQDVSTLRLPDTMQGVILARLDRLEAQARETLQYAAVIGRSFSQALLAAVSPRSQQVEQHLQQLQSLELVYQHRILPDLEYIFKHFVIREVAYNNILAKQRKALHQEIAKAIEQTYRDRLEDYYEVLAHHFEAGEDWQKAADYYGKAGTRARELHADEGANALVEKRDQAVQKVFEQKQGKSRYRQVSIPFLVVAVIWQMVFLYRIRAELLQAPILLGFELLILLFCFVVVVRFIRFKVADSMLIYADRLVIRGRSEFTQIPFSSISTVDRLPFVRRGGTMRAMASALWQVYFTKGRSIYGAFGFARSTRDFHYYRVSSALKIAPKEYPPLFLWSDGIGDLYRELKLAMIKWAAEQQVALNGVFVGSPSRFEEQYHLLLRSAGGAPLGPVTYGRLIERIENSEVGPEDEVGCKREGEEAETWLSLGRASQEDSRLRAAFHPMRYGARRSFPFLIVTAGIATAVWVLNGPPIPIWITLFVTIVLGSLSLVLAGVPGLVCLRYGFLEWSKRKEVTGWQRLGLRVVTGIGVPVIIAGLGWLGLSLPIPRGPRSSLPQAIAHAMPLTNIHIDGQLDDWPAGTRRYSISINPHANGPTDLDDKDLATSADLSPEFMVGYDPAENLLYLAVQVRDDSLVVNNLRPDVCDVYVDGDHSGETVSYLRLLRRSASNLAALQYVAFPGEAPQIEGHKGNPSLFLGDIGQTRTRMAWSRQADTTIYEWAVQAFDHYPDAPTQLVPGKTIGFDVAVADKDGQDDNQAWICWGGPEGNKVSDAGILGDLVLDAGLGEVESTTGENSLHRE